MFLDIPLPFWDAHIPSLISIPMIMNRFDLAIMSARLQAFSRHKKGLRCIQRYSLGLLLRHLAGEFYENSTKIKEMKTEEVISGNDT